MLKLCDKNVEYNPEFRFYITTKMPNPHFRPEIASKTTIVNFAVKEQVCVYLVFLITCFVYKFKFKTDS